MTYGKFYDIIIALYFHRVTIAHMKTKLPKTSIAAKNQEFARLAISYSTTKKVIAFSVKLPKQKSRYMMFDHVIRYHLPKGTFIDQDYTEIDIKNTVVNVEAFVGVCTYYDVLIREIN